VQSHMIHEAGQQIGREQAPHLHRSGERTTRRLVIVGLSGAESRPFYTRPSASSTSTVTRLIPPAIRRRRLSSLRRLRWLRAIWPSWPWPTNLPRLVCCRCPPMAGRRRRKQEADEHPKDVTQTHRKPSRTRCPPTRLDGPRAAVGGATEVASTRPSRFWRRVDPIMGPAISLLWNFLGNRTEAAWKIAGEAGKSIRASDFAARIRNAR